MSDEWSFVETEIDGLPAFFRLRTDVAGLAASETYSTWLRVVWEYEPDLDYHLPSDAELELLDVFEERLCEALERDEHAVLVFVVTSDGLRQWLFYTKDVDETGRRINAMPQERDPYPIELTAGPDPEWTEYHDIVAGIGATTS